MGMEMALSVIGGDQLEDRKLECVRSKEPRGILLPSGVYNPPFGGVATDGQRLDQRWVALGTDGRIQAAGDQKVRIPMKPDSHSDPCRTAFRETGQ